MMLTAARTSSIVRSGVAYLRRCLSSTASALPTEADVVVIGGGSIGCNTLFHLAEMGHTNVVLLEKDKLTAGTTWHTAGLLWQLRPSDVDIQLIARGRSLNADILPKEYGLETGWINNGGLFIASSKERLDEYKRLMTIGRAFGIESHVMGPKDILKLYPLMNTTDVYGGLCVPGDGLIDPSGYCNALARAAGSKGTKVVENCPVTGIETGTDDMGYRKILGVKTANGYIKTNIIANCAGAWAPQIGEMANVPVPLCVMRHAYVITDRIEGIQNMPNTRDHDANVYLRLQGDALAVGGYEPYPEFISDLPRDFAFSLYDLNYDVFGVHIENAINRIPVLGNTGIKSEVCGPESFTADHKPLLGEAPNLPGYFHGCGFNSAGMMYGGGCGQQLAHWICHGRPELWMHQFDIRRFYRDLITDRRWIDERSHESYAKNYSIVFPNDEPLACRGKRLDPFYDQLLHAGCVFQERLGWERPAWFLTGGKTAPLLPYDYYGSYGHAAHEDYTYRDALEQDYTFDEPANEVNISAEAAACRNKVAAFNMSYFGKFIITGRDSQAFVDWVFSGDLQKSNGITVYTCMLNHMGGIEADLTVSRIEPGLETQLDDGGPVFYVAAGGAIGEHVRAHMHSQRSLKSFNVDIAEITNDMGLLSIQGPNSRALLQTLTDTDLSDDAFAFGSNRLVQVAGHACRMIRLSFVGELGYELHVPRPGCAPVYDALMQAGAPFGLKNAGYRAIDALSLEKGYRLWGTDVRNDVTPLEAGLLFTCKLKTDVDFCGRAAVEKARKAGARRRVAVFTTDSHKRLWGLETVYREGNPVGFLQRADYAYTLKKNMGVGYISRPDGEKVTPDWLKSGSYTIEVMGEEVPAQIHLKSPFDPKGNRLKGIYE